MTKKDEAPATYTAVYKRDADGWWTVEVREAPGCVSQGRTVGQARARIREALALYLDVKHASALTIHDEIINIKPGNADGQE